MLLLYILQKYILKQKNSHFFKFCFTPISELYGTTVTTTAEVYMALLSRLLMAGKLPTSPYKTRKVG